MSLLKQREKGGIDRRKSLAGVPILHANVNVAEGEDRVVRLQVRTERGSGLMDRFRPPVTERCFELDEFGAFVVREIQGRKNVLDIILAFERRFGLSHRESELGVVAFIKMLMKRDILSVVLEQNSL